MALICLSRVENCCLLRRLSITRRRKLERFYLEPVVSEFLDFDVPLEDVVVDGVGLNPRRVRRLHDRHQIVGQNSRSSRGGEDLE